MSGVHDLATTTGRLVATCGVAACSCEARVYNGSVSSRGARRFFDPRAGAGRAAWGRALGGRPDEETRDSDFSQSVRSSNMRKSTLRPRR